MRVDDARLVIDVVRTAAGYGALAASRTQVVGFTMTHPPRHSAELADPDTGERLVRAQSTSSTQPACGPKSLSPWLTPMQAWSLASKGIHIVVPRDRINATSGIFTKTREVRSLIIPGSVTGSSAPPTPLPEDRERPVATSKDID